MHLYIGKRLRLSFSYDVGRSILRYLLNYFLAHLADITWLLIIIREERLSLRSVAAFELLCS